MLVESAVGDAYGAGFEYADPAFVAAHNTLRGYAQHPRHLGIRPGAYTDDTQMTLAIAELLVAGDPWTPLELANRFVAAFHRDPREGYAGRFYDFLRSVHDGAEFLRRIRPDSDKSGAAMRATPIGLLPTVDDVLHHAAVQAAVTHDTPAGIASAQAAALAVHYCHYELGPLAKLPQWVDSHVPNGWSRPWRGKVGSKGRMSVGAALTALSTSGTMSDLLRTCVAFTGDVDTVATIALAAAARSPEITQDLPAVLLANLENGTYGRDYLARLNGELLGREHGRVGLATNPGQ
ncbi:ADP-ribosylglycohydrolase family protein [Nocardia xishanensis]